MDAVEKFLAGITPEMDPPDECSSVEQLERWAMVPVRRIPRDRYRISHWLEIELSEAARGGNTAAGEVLNKPRMVSRIRSLADDVWTDGRPATRREFIDGTFRRYHGRYGIDPATMSLIWLMIRAVVFFLWRLYQIRNGCAPGAATVEA